MSATEVTKPTYLVRYENGTAGTMECSDKALVVRLSSLYGWGEGGVKSVVSIPPHIDLDLQANRLLPYVPSAN